MKIINYRLYVNRVDVYLSNGQILTINLNENSGKAYFRYKIDTISQIKHPAIFIGTDCYNIEYFIHNHYQIGTASLVIRSEFDKGNPIYIYKEKCSNDRMTVLSRVFSHLMRGERYNFITYNCQTMVNDACDNQRRSQAAENWAAGLAITGALALLLAACSGRK